SDVLATIDGEAHRVRDDSGSGLESPELATRLLIERLELALRIADEEHPAPRGQHAGVHRPRRVIPPRSLPGRKIDGAHVTGGRRNTLMAAAVVRLPLLVIQVEREELAAHLDRRHVHEMGERAIRHRDPLLARRTVAA